MKFVWDERKSQRNRADPNRRKGFEEAIALWMGDYKKHPVNVNSLEQVYIISGLLEGVVWGAFVVHRPEEVRVISGV